MADSRKKRILGILELLVRLGLGGLFVFSAIGKIEDPALFADAVMRYKMLPGALVGLFSLVLPMVEMLSGLTLIFTVWVREGALFVVVQLCMFIVALSQALLRGLDISCGCFGVPSTGGAQELAIALVRDIVLLVPAAWLLFRDNGWIWGTVLHARAIVLSCLVILPASLLAVNVSEGPAVKNEWNGNFGKTFEQARREGVPMVLLCGRRGCFFCSRIDRVLAGNVFAEWLKGHELYLASVQETAHTEDSSNAVSFVSAVSPNLVDYPQVCVWMPKGGGAATNVFVAQRGRMPGIRSESLALELTSALDAILGSNCVNAAKAPVARKISVKVVGGEGSVEMTPQSGILYDDADSEVLLRVKATKDVYLLGWTDPEGRDLGMKNLVRVTPDMPAGQYVARFRRSADIAPPSLTLPTTSLWAKVGRPFRYEFRVDEACRPASFRVRMPPQGLVMHSIEGYLYGTPLQAGEYAVEVFARGNDPLHTVSKGTVTIVVEEGDNNAAAEKGDKHE